MKFLRFFIPFFLICFGTAAAPVRIPGEIVGPEFGYDIGEPAGCRSAFDGDPETFFDSPIHTSDQTTCGLALAEPYILTEIRVLPRLSHPERFVGSEIQGSNDGENWYRLWQCREQTDYGEWITVTDFEMNPGFRFYRIYNSKNRGEVSELEFYGFPGEIPSDEKIETLREITVSFVSQCENELPEMIVEPGSLWPELPVPDCQGSEFKGWFTRSVGGIQIIPGNTVTQLSDCVLYAQWY